MILCDQKKRFLFSDGWKSSLQPFFFPTNEFYPISTCQKVELDIGITKANAILNSISIFKVFSISFLSFFNYYLTKNFIFITNEINYLNQKVIPTLLNWERESILNLNIATVSFGFCYIFFTFFTQSRMYFALAIAFGLDIPDTINAPWKAKSFRDFFSRTMYYYNHLIARFFYLPLLNLLNINRFQSKKLTSLLNKFSLFVSLTLGGLFLHFTYNIEKIYLLGFIGLIKYTLNKYLTYIVTLSLSVVIFNFECKKFRTLQFLIFFYVFTLLTILTILSKEFNIIQILNFYFKLFNII
jgi:hypothetical protein